MPPVPLWMELGKFCTYTNPCVHTHMYYFYIKNHEFVLMSLTPSQHQRVHSKLFPIPYLYLLSPDNEKPGSHYLQYIDLLVEPSCLYAVVSKLLHHTPVRSKSTKVQYTQFILCLTLEYPVKTPVFLKIRRSAPFFITLSVVISCFCNTVRLILSQSAFHPPPPPPSSG